MTLREQTIWRGLRLPDEERTENKAVDQLTIVAHDKFEEVINAANEKTSIIKQKNVKTFEKVITTKDLSKPEVIEMIKEKTKQSQTWN